MFSGMIDPKLHVLGACRARCNRKQKDLSKIVLLIIKMKVKLCFNLFHAMHRIKTFIFLLQRPILKSKSTEMPFYNIVDVVAVS